MLTAKLCHRHSAFALAQDRKDLRLSVSTCLQSESPHASCREYSTYAAPYFRGDTRKRQDAIADHGAHAFIPPRKNARPWKPATAGAIARNKALRASKYLGRASWRNWSGYHRRSRAGTKMHCMKLLGQRLMARDFDRQVAEVQVRIAIMNGYTALGMPVTKTAG